PAAARVHGKEELHTQELEIPQPKEEDKLPVSRSWWGDRFSASGVDPDGSGGEHQDGRPVKEELVRCRHESQELAARKAGDTHAPGSREPFREIGPAAPPGQKRGANEPGSKREAGGKGRRSEKQWPIKTGHEGQAEVL